jgi:hypothetical protein
VPGVLDKDKNLLTDLTPSDILALEQEGTISGGMIPKLQTCTHGGSGLRGGGRARWPRAACYAAGVLHLARGGNADSQGLRD